MAILRKQKKEKLESEEKKEPMIVSKKGYAGEIIEEKKEESIKEIDQRDREEKLGADLEHNLRENKDAEELLKAFLGGDVFERDEKPGDLVALEEVRENLNKKYDEAEGKEPSKKEEPKPRESEKDKKEKGEKMKRRIKFTSEALEDWGLSVSDMRDENDKLTEPGWVIMNQVRLMELEADGKEETEAFKKLWKDFQRHKEKWLSSKEEEKEEEIIELTDLVEGPEAPTLSRDPDPEGVGDKWIEDLTKNPKEQVYIKERFEKVLEILKEDSANKELSEEKLREVAAKLSTEAFKKK